MIRSIPFALAAFSLFGVLTPEAAVAQAVTASTQPASLGPLTASDLAMLERVSAPRLSPNGRHLAYVVRRTDWNRNTGTSNLEILDLEGANAKPIVLSADEQGELGERWSDDGKWLYFMSSRSGSQQVWKTSPDGSIQQQVTDFPVGLRDFRPAPDQTALFVTVNAYPDCVSLACIIKSDEEHTQTTGGGVHIKAGPARFGESYEDDKLVSLFRAELTDSAPATEARRIVKDFASDLSISDEAMAFTNDGSALYFVSLDPAVEKGEESSRNLYFAPTDGASPPRLVLGGINQSISSLALSPDGRKLAYLATRGSIWTFGRTALMVLDLESGSRRELAPNDDVLFQQLVWSSDGKRLLATAEARGQGPLYEIDPQTGRRVELLNDGVVSQIGEASGSLVYLRDSFNSPHQIFVRRAGQPDRQVTRIGADVLDARSLSAWEQFSFSGWNDETVHGYVMKPYGHVEGRTYPVAFLIHGGPQQSFSNSWSYRWNPQVWAGMGYAVVMIDFHGSTGYGEAFGQASIGHWQDRPLEDLQKGWAHVTRAYPFLDGERACAIGGSYGGFMVNWIASQWNEPWRCLVSHAGIFDTRYLRRSMSISAFVDAQLAVTGPEDLERPNPSLHIDRWRTPLLVTHGTNDYIVPIDQGLSAYNAARRTGVTTEMLIFPGEGHMILEPQNSVQWYEATQAWLNRWTAPP